MLNFIFLIIIHVKMLSKIFGNFFFIIFYEGKLFDLFFYFHIILTELKEIALLIYDISMLIKACLQSNANYV